MRTGEGKTLVATAPLYLNALTGKGTHLVTVNDYLARRDATWMGQIYYALGLTLGIINHETSYLYDPGFEAAEPLAEGSPEDKQRDTLGAFRIEYSFLRPCSRQEAYAADITYGTNNEFGFDYLRDNMAPDLERMVQRAPNFAVIDEVDSILIDEARTPLIISAPAEEATQMYLRIYAKIIRRLRRKRIMSSTKNIASRRYLTHKARRPSRPARPRSAGRKTIPRRSSTWTPRSKRETLYKLDKNYVVDEGEVIIVDEFTGRLMHGRRYSEGLHQAIEAKEGVKIQRESPDARDDHLSKSFPHVSQALRHDRHGRDRSGRIL